MMDRDDDYERQREFSIWRLTAECYAMMFNGLCEFSKSKRDFRGLMNSLKIWTV